MKAGKIIILLFLLICVTGCKSNLLTENISLSCEYKSNDQEMENVTSYLDAVYDEAGETLLSRTVVTNIDFKAPINVSVEDLNKDCDPYKDIKGVSCKVTANENIYSIRIDYDYNLITNDFLEEDNFYPLPLSDYKEILKTSGYICD